MNKSAFEHVCDLSLRRSRHPMLESTPFPAIAIQVTEESGLLFIDRSAAGYAIYLRFELTGRLSKEELLSLLVISSKTEIGPFPEGHKQNPCSRYLTANDAQKLFYLF